MPLLEQALITPIFPIVKAALLVIVNCATKLMNFSACLSRVLSL